MIHVETESSCKPSRSELQVGDPTRDAEKSWTVAAQLALLPPFTMIWASPKRQPHADHSSSLDRPRNAR